MVKDPTGKRFEQRPGGWEDYVLVDSALISKPVMQRSSQYCHPFCWTSSDCRNIKQSPSSWLALVGITIRELVTGTRNYARRCGLLAEHSGVRHRLRLPASLLACSVQVSTTSLLH